MVAFGWHCVCERASTLLNKYRLSSYQFSKRHSFERKFELQRYRTTCARCTASLIYGHILIWFLRSLCLYSEHLSMHAMHICLCVCVCQWNNSISINCCVLGDVIADILISKRCLLNCPSIGVFIMWNCGAFYSLAQVIDMQWIGTRQSDGMKLEFLA